MPTASGVIAEPLQKLRRMVASSAAFRTETGTDTLEAALEKVYLRDGIDEDRPLAVVSIGELPTWKLFAGGLQNYLQASGQLWLYLARDTPAEYQDDGIEAEIDAANWFGAVLSEVLELAGADDPGQETGFPSIHTATSVLFDETPKDKHHSLGRFFYCGYLLEWGDQS